MDQPHFSIPDQAFSVLLACWYAEAERTNWYKRASHFCVLLIVSPHDQPLLCHIIQSIIDFTTSSDCVVLFCNTWHLLHFCPSWERDPSHVALSEVSTLLSFPLPQCTRISIYLHIWPPVKACFIPRLHNSNSYISNCASPSNEKCHELWLNFFFFFYLKSK